MRSDMFRRGTSLPLALTILLSTLCAAAEPNEHAHEHEHDDHWDTETIVVTASPLEHDRDEIAIPIDTVDRGELIEHLGGTLGDSLSHLPGIASTGFSTGASRPVIRGQDAYRTEVLEDGLGMGDVSKESPDHAVPINPLVAQRVEIVRGPATLRYGGGASAGVVNVITNRVPDRLPEDEIAGDVFGGIGTVANERDLAVGLDGRHGLFALHADGLLRRSNDYQIPNDDGPHQQNGTQTQAYSGSIGGAYIEDERGRLGFAYTRVENKYGIPEVGESVEIDMTANRFRFEGDLHEPISGIREFRVRGVYTDYEHDEAVDGDVGQTYRNDEFEGRIEVLHVPVLGLIGAVGLHGRTREFEAKGEAAEFLAPTDTEMVALYAFEELELTDGLSGEFGLRIEHTHVDGTDITDQSRDRDFFPLSGSVGLVSSPTDGLTIGAVGSISQRAPSQVELLARGAHEATSTFEIGDPELDEETAFTAELRMEFKGARGRLAWAGFATRYEDYIFGQLTGQFVDAGGNPIAPTDPDALDQVLYQERDALFYGTEISGEFDVHEFDAGSVGLDGQFDFVRARFTNGSHRDLPRITPIRWGGGLSWTSEDISARVGFLRTEAQNDNGLFESRTKGFTYLNASLTYRIAFFDGGVPLELTAVGRNLSDVRGRNHLAFNSDDVILPGRNFRFGIRASF